MTSVIAISSFVCLSDVCNASLSKLTDLYTNQMTYLPNYFRACITDQFPGEQKIKSNAKLSFLSKMF